MIKIAEVERAELGLYFRMKTIGEGRVISAFGDVVASMDTMSASLGRMRSGLTQTTKALGIQSPELESLIGTFQLGEGVIRTFTGTFALLTTAMKTYEGVAKVVTFLMDTEFYKALVKAGVGLVALIAKTWAYIGSLWAQVTAQLAAIASNPLTLPLLAGTLAVIGGIIVAMAALQRQTKETARSMEHLGDVSYKRSVFPELLEWIRRVRSEASKPIEVNVRVTEEYGLRRSSSLIGRAVGEEVAFQVARVRR